MKMNFTKRCMCLTGGLLVMCLTTFAQLTLPAGSQKATVSQRVGITDISISYSRPAVKGRLVWGALVPYGMNNLGFGTAKESPWRAGADENTVFQVSDDVTVEGKNLKKGAYGLHMIVQQNGDATIIFSGNHTAWGSFFYEPSEDVLRVDVKSKEIQHTELLTYVFNAADPGSATVALQWEKKEIPFRVEVPVKTIVLENIKRELQSSPGFRRVSWEQAAGFALNNGDLDQALKWIDAAIAGQFFSQKTYANLSLKSQILNKKGDTAGASALLEESASMANTNQLNLLGYQMLTLKRYDKAIEYFERNVKNNPADANGYDSLGEAYKTKGDSKNAIKNLKKSLTLNPAPNVKANSIKLLKELGVSEEGK